MVFHRLVGVAILGSVVGAAYAGPLTMDIYSGKDGMIQVADNSAWDIDPAVNSIEVNNAMLFDQCVQLVEGTSLKAYSVQGPGGFGQVIQDLKFQASPDLPHVGFNGRQEAGFIVRTYQTDFNMVNVPMNLTAAAEGSFTKIWAGYGVEYSGGLNLGNVGDRFSPGEGKTANSFSVADPKSYTWSTSWNRTVADPFAMTTYAFVDLFNSSFQGTKETITAAAVPEPATIALLGAGVALICRRKR